MSLYLLTPQAEDDLFDIWSCIAQDNLVAARNRSLGYAHLFRPMYAGANMGHPSSSFGTVQQA